MAQPRDLCYYRLTTHVFMQTRVGYVFLMPVNVPPLPPSEPRRAEEEDNCA